MTRAALAFAITLAGCTHVQVLPVISPNKHDVSCCVAYAEIPPSTHLSVTVKRGNTGTSVNLGAARRF